MSVKPGRLDLNGKYQQAAPIRRGDTFSHPITFVDGAGLPIDKSTLDEIRAQIRVSAGNQNVVAEFGIEITGAGSNIVTIALPSETTTLMTPGKYVWDLQETSGTDIVTRLAGEVLVSSDISRD